MAAGFPIWQRDWRIRLRGFHQSVERVGMPGWRSGHWRNLRHGRESRATKLVGGAPEDYGEQSPLWKKRETILHAPRQRVLPNTVQHPADRDRAGHHPVTPIARPEMPWPGAYIVQPQEARENAPIFFRRALKLVNATNINLGTCPDARALRPDNRFRKPCLRAGRFQRRSERQWCF